MKHIMAFVLSALLLMASGFSAFAEPAVPVAPERTAELNTASNKVVIYSGAEEYRNEYFKQRLSEEFPDYDIVIEYMPTGNLAAKLAAEGTDTDMDIFYDLDFPITISRSMLTTAK